MKYLTTRSFHLVVDVLFEIFLLKFNFFLSPGYLYFSNKEILKKSTYIYGGNLDRCSLCGNILKMER